MNFSKALYPIILFKDSDLIIKMEV